MEVELYGSYSNICFNPQSINFVIEDCFECITHFKGGKKISLSYSGVKDTLLRKFPRVFSHELLCPIYINTQNVALYKSGFMGTLSFTDGTSLNNLSGVDVDKLISKIETYLTL